MNTQQQTAGVNPKGTDMQQPVKDTTLVQFVPHGAADPIKLSVKIVQNLIAVPTKSGKSCSERDALKFIAMCQAKRLNPFEGDAFLIGYDTQNGPSFSLITAHQAFIKRAEIHPEYDGMKSGIIVQNEDGSLADMEGDFYLANQTPVGGWATVYFKNRRIPTSRRLRMERFNNGFAQWKVDAAGMICKCAEADALRSSFPTMLGGLYTREETDRLTIDVNSGMESAASKLVALEPGSTPALPEPKREAEPGTGAIAETPQTQLQILITENGFSMDDLLRWGRDSGNISEADADRITDFDDVPPGVATRLVRARAGLLAGLGKLKGAA